ncbi:High mobility group [Coemansia sp. RSA 2131]|nr:High mobility group [Coemansia sp. RSA 2131]
MKGTEAHMIGDSPFGNILAPHFYQTLQLASNMENFPTLDNIASASFQTLSHYPYRQQQNQQNQQQAQEQARLGTDKQNGQVSGLLFDIPVLSNGADVTQSGPLSAPVVSAMNAGNYPLALDPMHLQGSGSFGGFGASGPSMDRTSHGVGTDVGLGMSGPGTGSGLTSSQLSMHGLAGTNSAGFMSSPLGTPLSIPNSMQPTPQPLHTNMPLIPPARPYNMMFGMPALPDAPLYDDRMHGSWLRIRQPIDYVAPLKKPMNSFLLYSAERRVQLRQTHPDLNTTQQSTILAREWATLAEDEKERYRAEAKQLRDDYNARRAELSLKLQQQLNQQHIGLMGQSLQNAVHGDMLSQSVMDGHAMHASFGMHQPFNTAGMTMGHSQFPQLPQGQKQDESYVHVPTSMSGQLPFDPALALDSSANHVQALTGRNTPQTLDIGAPGFLPNIYDRRDNKWQDFGTELRPNTAQSYGALRPASSMSHAYEYQRQPAYKQPVYDDHDILTSTMLSTNNLFDNPFDPVSQPPLDTSDAKFTHSSMNLSDLRTNPLDYDSQTIGLSTTNMHAASDIYGERHMSSKASSAGASTKRTPSSPPKRARKKSKKDPSAPKHPMSAFLYYLTSERPRLADQLGDMSIGQQTKIIAKYWKALDENDRAPWEKLAKHDKDRYARERREYQGETRRSVNTLN